MARAIDMAGQNADWHHADGAAVRAIDGPGANLLEQALLGELGRVVPCRWLMDDHPGGPQHGVDGDTVLGATLDHGTVMLRVWRNPRCLVASNRQARLPAFAFARAVSEAAGWPIAVRRSGGTAVAHRPGILNFSLISAQAPGGGISVGGDYDALLAILRDMLGAIDIRCDAGNVSGAHCDGRYNLRWLGRKLAGTAGCVVRIDGRTLRIFHASLQVSGGIEDDLGAIQRFEAALGEAVAYDPLAHVSVERILGDHS